MTRDGRDRIAGYFDTCARDVTPSTGRHEARVFYAPVSSDPKATRSCASVLSTHEIQRSNRFASQDDKALFIQRRAFRRFCGAHVLETSHSFSQIDFAETENGRPYLTDLPNLCFSFSSCRFGMLAAWSSTRAVGVDIEDHTKELEAVELARQYFSPAEAGVVAGAGGAERLQTFYRFWSLKEAALKSIGEGLPFGLNAFEFELKPTLRIVRVPPAAGTLARFSASEIEGTGSGAALVIRSPA